MFFSTAMYNRKFRPYTCTVRDYSLRKKKTTTQKALLILLLYRKINKYKKPTARVSDEKTANNTVRNDTSGIRQHASSRVSWQFHEFVISLWIFFISSLQKLNFLPVETPFFSTEIREKRREKNKNKTSFKIAELFGYSSRRLGSDVTPNRQ